MSLHVPPSLLLNTLDMLHPIDAPRTAPMGITNNQVSIAPSILSQHHPMHAYPNGSLIRLRISRKGVGLLQVTKDERYMANRSGRFNIALHSKCKPSINPPRAILIINGSAPHIRPAMAPFCHVFIFVSPPLSLVAGVGCLRRKDIGGWFLLNCGFW